METSTNKIHKEHPMQEEQEKKIIHSFKVIILHLFQIFKNVNFYTLVILIDDRKQHSNSR
jgi:hypothetical protein